MEEYLELYDDSKIRTGIKIPRSKEKELPDGMHILIAALIIMNSHNQIMLQLTSPEKGSIYSLPSGHVLYGENSEDTVIREMYEEQGIKISKDEIKFLGERLANRIAFFDIYYLKRDYTIDEMNLQKEEVANVVWTTFEEIDSLYELGKLRKSSFEAIKLFVRKA